MADLPGWFGEQQRLFRRSAPGAFGKGRTASDGLSADASWWGEEAEFDADIQERLKSSDPAVRAEAQRLLIARNARKSQGRNPFQSQAAPQPAAQPNAQEAPQQDARRPFNMQPYSQSQPMNPALMAQQVSSAQARHLGGMISDVTGAIQDENDSRVAQMREQRRMAHEMEMEAMRQEALLQRLAMEQREREKDRILQKQLQTGVTTRRLVNGRWEDV
jgi:hypothetical protein